MPIAFDFIISGEKFTLINKNITQETGEPFDALSTANSNSIYS